MLTTVERPTSITIANTSEAHGQTIRPEKWALSGECIRVSEKSRKLLKYAQRELSESGEAAEELQDGGSRT